MQSIVKNSSRRKRFIFPSNIHLLPPHQIDLFVYWVFYANRWFGWQSWLTSFGRSSRRFGSTLFGTNQPAMRSFGKQMSKIRNKGIHFCGCSELLSLHFSLVLINWSSRTMEVPVRILLYCHWHKSSNSESQEWSLWLKQQIVYENSV